MKKVTILVLVALVALPVAVSADVPAPEGPFNTAFRVQNLGDEDANCTFSFYDADGVSQYDSGALSAVAPGDSLYVYVPDTTVVDGQYAGVVSCDQPVAAVANFSDADSGASYNGVTEVADTVYAPGIYDNYFGFYSDIVVQNASSGLNDITLEIYEPGTETPVYENTQEDVASNGFVSWEQEGLAELEDNQFYSAKISGTGDVAAVVNIYGGTGTGNEDTLFSYNTFDAGSTELYAPVIMNDYFGYTTALVIQNMGTSDAEVTVTYSDAGTASDWSKTIAPGAAESLYAGDSTFNIPTGELLGAKIESDGEPLAVIINEQTVYNRAGTYNGFAAGATSAKAPVVMKGYFKWNSSITCQNVGTGAADMSISYTDISGTFDVQGGGTVPEGDVGLFYQPDHITDASYIGSATITSDQPVVCVVNQDQNLPPESTTVMDQLFVYNAITE